MAIARTGPTNGCAHGPGCPHDIGPAAARTEGLDAMGRLSSMRVSEYLQANTATAAGAGPIERRQATPDELAHLEPPRPPRREIPMHMLRPARAAAVTEEEPVSTPAAPPAVPCGDCLHAPVCALKERAEAAVAEIAAVRREIQPGLRLRVSAGFECDHHLPVLALRETTQDRLRPGPVAEVAPVPTDAERAAASRRRGNAAMLEAKGRRGGFGQRVTDDQVVAALRQTAGDAEAAGRAIGVSGSAVRLRVKAMRSRSELPEDVSALLAGRARKAVA